MDKKGILPANVVKLILIAVTLVILSFFLANYIGILTGEFGKDVCRARLEMVSVKLLGMNIVNSLADFCKEEKVPIKVVDEDYVFKKLADKMYACWWRYGEGRKDFFNIWEKLATELAYTGCLECYSFTFYDIEIPEERLEQDENRLWYIPNFREDFTEYFTEYLKKKGKKIGENTVKYHVRGDNSVYITMEDNMNFYVHGDGVNGDRLYITKEYKIYQHYLFPGLASDVAEKADRRFIMINPNFKDYFYEQNVIGSGLQLQKRGGLSEVPPFHLVFSSTNFLNEVAVKSEAGACVTANVKP